MWTRLPSVGEQIGRYRIDSRLGGGGMGVVYGATDVELGRKVALKLVKPCDPMERERLQARERLKREAQALARLSHPNVVTLYDVGMTPHGAYLAMQYIEGVELGRWLRHKPHTWQEILTVFLAAGRGLAAAHAAGVIHRDFKPTNVIVGSDSHVTVVDFGLARSTERGQKGPSAADSTVAGLLGTKLTGTNVIVGTRGYMAPEQLLALEITPACDQFAFCVALFEALYGSRPYPGRNAVETAKAFSEGRLIEPADRRGVPTWLHQVLLRGLSVEPNERFMSMDELLAALDRPLIVWQRHMRWGAAMLTTAVVAAAVTLWHERERPSSSAVVVTTCPLEPTVDPEITPASAATR